MKTDILVITALALEFQAVERLLTQVVDVRHTKTGAYYKRGTFNAGLNFSVAVVECGAGNVPAAQETERALSFFTPEYVFFVGVAGGIKDVSIGDVVVSSEVIHYEGGKAAEVYRPRLNIIRGSYELVSLAKLIARDARWQHRINDGLGSFNAEVKPIAAGEQVVASQRSVVYELLSSSVSQAIAVEMEGYGVLSPLDAHGVKGIVIRGISDLLENKEGADASGSQPLAARNAAAFFAEMLALLAQERTQTADIADKQPNTSDTQHNSNTSPAADLLQNRDWRNRLAKTLTDLYEQGPGEQGGAWKRAGGKIHFLNNSSSVQAQWHTAVERLAQGGAGDITLVSLLEAVKDEFGSNLAVQRLCQELGLV